MFDRFSDESRRAVHFATREAISLNHEYVGTEHLLLGALQEASETPTHTLNQMIQGWGLTTSALRDEVKRTLQEGPDKVRGKPPFTPRSKKVFERARNEAFTRNLPVNPEHLVIGILQEHESVAATTLNNNGITLERALSTLPPVPPKAHGLLLPKYLTAEIARLAVQSALSVVIRNNAPLRSYVDGDHCHVVVLVPGMKDDRTNDYPDYPNYPLEPVVLYNHSVGHPSDWASNYKDIAHCKALQLWHDRNDGGINPIPHLLFPGDTHYWGGVKRSGVVVACSGVQSRFDRLIASMVADIMITLAHDAYENDPERTKHDFLS